MSVTFPPNQSLHEFWADNTKNFNYELYGAEICQNRTSLIFLSRLLEQYRPEVIIEVGTYTGGLSIHFGLYGALKGIPVHTWDIEDKRQNNAIFHALSIQFHLDDCFSAKSDELIKSLLKTKRALVFCDGGNKIKEFIYYSDLLKKGDLICCHDFAYDKETFERDVYLKSWGWHEISWADIKDAVARNGLNVIEPNVATVAAMAPFIKT